MKSGSFMFFGIAMMTMVMTVEKVRGKAETHQTTDNNVDVPIDSPAEREAGLVEKESRNNKVV